MIFRMIFHNMKLLCIYIYTYIYIFIHYYIYIYSLYTYIYIYTHYNSIRVDQIPMFSHEQKAPRSPRSPRRWRLKLWAPGGWR